MIRFRGGASFMPLNLRDVILRPGGACLPEGEVCNEKFHAIRDDEQHLVVLLFWTTRQEKKALSGCKVSRTRLEPHGPHGPANIKLE